MEFDLDLNGILKVSAKDRGSKKVEQTTVHAAHTRLSPKDQTASVRYLEEVWSNSAGDLEVLPPELLTPREDDEPVLAKARALLADEPGWGGRIGDLVKRVDQAKSEGRQEAVEELLDQLLDLLYEGEDEDDDEEIEEKQVERSSGRVEPFMGSKNLP